MCSYFLLYKELIDIKDFKKKSDITSVQTFSFLLVLDPVCIFVIRNIHVILCLVFAHLGPISVIVVGHPVVYLLTSFWFCLITSL